MQCQIAGKRICMRIAPHNENSRAIGIAMMPTFGKSQNVTLIFSLCKAISQRIVAREPVMRGLGQDPRR
jgi:hypothetical protein